MFFILAESRDAGENWTDLFDRHYTDGASAQQEAARLNRVYKQSYYHSDIRYRVRKVVDTDSDNFYTREAAKNLTPITRDGLPEYGEWHRWELPHIDPDNKRHIRFFRTIEDAIQGQYTSIRMSRYFSNCGIAHEDFEEKLIDLGFYEGEREFKILRNEDEIETAYTNGPRSCMNDPEDYPLYGIHPSRVYASPDLGLAVVMAKEECVARTVCWPEKKIYGVVYGHKSLLKKELEALGYRRTTAWTAWRGARLLRIFDKDENAYVCPYLDMSDTVSESRDKKFLRIAGPHGKLASRSCNGYSYVE